MPVHDVAKRGFGSAAEDYERGRPGYPRGNELVGLPYLCEVYCILAR